MLVIAFAAVTPTKQSQKTQIGANRDHCAYVNSPDWTNMIRGILTDSLGRDILRVLELEPDFSGQARDGNVPLLHLDLEISFFEPDSLQD